jgi:hypothetical protein
MLNKVLIGTIVNAVLHALKLFFPEIPFPEGLSEALIIVIVFVSQFFTRETALSVGKLVLK